MNGTDASRRKKRKIERGSFLRRDDGKTVARGKRVIGHRVAILEHAEIDGDGERRDSESVEGRGETEEPRDGKERGWTEKEKREREREDADGSELAKLVQRRMSKKKMTRKCEGR